MVFRKKWVGSAAALSLLAMTGLAGCGGTTAAPAANEKPTSSAQQEKKDELPPVKLRWVVRATPQKDQQLVQDAVNKITKAKINAEVQLDFIDPGAPYDQKVKTMLAAGDDFDVIFTGSPSGYGDFYGSVAKGAFLDITDLLPKYAPKTYDLIPKDFWKAVTVNKKIYGIPNYQIVARQNGILMQKSMMDKYQFSLDSVKKLEDLEPLLAKMKAGEDKSKIVFGMTKSGPFFNAMEVYYGLDPVGPTATVGSIHLNDDKMKVINQFEDPAFQNRVNLARDWFQKGYINKDAATVTNLFDQEKAGNVLSMWNPAKPGGLADLKVQYGGRDVVQKVLDVPFVTNDNIAATLQAINKRSKNPERALMFVELLNTDKELYNLICFGIEGKHYKKVGDNRIEPIANSGYNPNKSWAFGNQFNAYLLPGQDDNVWQETIDLNNKATRSKLLGFVFDQEPVKTEIAQCQSVMDEYLPGLLTGFVDPTKYLPEFLSKLKTAGADKIIAEKQKQIDAWKAANQ